MGVVLWRNVGSVSKTAEKQLSAPIIFITITTVMIVVIVVMTLKKATSRIIVNILLVNTIKLATVLLLHSKLELAFKTA